MDPGQTKIMDITTRHLKYNTTINKILEFWKVEVQDYHHLLCSNLCSLVVIYEDLFNILSALYDEANLHKNVLEHIKTNRKYYVNITTKYLKSKKLDLVTWLSDMLQFDISADEICFHACGVFLNIHITVDFHFGHWTTLDIPEISHDLAVILSNVY